MGIDLQEMMFDPTELAPENFVQVLVVKDDEGKIRIQPSVQYLSGNDPLRQAISQVDWDGTIWGGTVEGMVLIGQDETHVVDRDDRFEWAGV